MDDTISRRAAIDALKEEKPTPFVNEDGSIDPFGAGRQNQWYRDSLAIMYLPSVQPEDKCGECDAWNQYKNYPRQQWIPISEKLPELDEVVLATTTWNDITMAWRIDICNWFIHEGDTNAETNDIIAWMPLPEPYKGNRNEQTDRR